MQCIKPAAASILTLTDGRPVTLLEVLGTGRFGFVHRGVLEGGWSVRRPVAVKRLMLAPDADPTEVMRSLGEVARRLVCVRHPSVIQLFEIDRTDSLHVLPHMPFVVQELVEGESLASLLSGWHRGPERRAAGDAGRNGRSAQLSARVSVDFALVVALRTAEALGAALFTERPDGTLAGLLHGDLSPRQILISNSGEVKVGDFGQFALGDGVSGVRARPMLEYSAPEVVWGGSPDARSDVFSLGAILREMLLGPRFAPGTKTREAMGMIRDGHFHENVLEPNIPRSLRDVLDQALATNPQNRYGHARAMAFDLRREMLRLGMTDAQTCVRHAIVGWCDAPSEPVDVVELDDADVEEIPPSSRRQSGVVPKGSLEDLEASLPEFLFGSKL